LTELGQRLTTRIFPQAGHGLLDLPPSDPRAPAILVDWVHGHVH
jgi:hypothetical protein